MVSVRCSASSSIQPTISTSWVSHCWTTAVTRPALSRLSRAATSGSRAVASRSVGAESGRVTAHILPDPQPRCSTELRTGQDRATRLRCPGDPQQPGIEARPSEVRDASRSVSSGRRPDPSGVPGRGRAGRGRCGGRGGSVDRSPGRRRSRGRSRPRSPADPRRDRRRVRRSSARVGSACSCPAMVRHGKERVALTFDACGGPRGSGYDKSIIATLRKQEGPGDAVPELAVDRGSPARRRRPGRRSPLRARQPRVAAPAPRPSPASRRTASGGRPVPARPTTRSCVDSTPSPR